jgi:hypothetical protein
MHTAPGVVEYSSLYTRTYLWDGAGSSGGRCAPVEGVATRGLEARDACAPTAFYVFTFEVSTPAGGSSASRIMDLINKLIWPFGARLARGAVKEERPHTPGNARA